MKWFKFEPQEEEITEAETSPVLVYLSPEALKHAVIVDDFGSFQDSPECIPGGRLFEVSRQYSYRLRQVADLVEEPLEDHNFQMKAQSKRNFHAEIRPDKRLNSTEDSMSAGSQNATYPESSLLDIAKNSGEVTQPLQKVRPEQVPFKDLESLFVK
ncbi:MAG: hypothetical protein CL909_05945 [Deltaproteobacteria bacterium]|nr:hypothetical protein [Deltaproteobacteria bacterium]MDP6488686.1 hypothetical protein [SAR324 cluster bacterium]HBR60068.1 hypothetical protein [Deltaproteobacteria bacterium]